MENLWAFLLLWDGNNAGDSVVRFVLSVFYKHQGQWSRDVKISNRASRLGIVDFGTYTDLRWTESS